MSGVTSLAVFTSAYVVWLGMNRNMRSVARATQTPIDGIDSTATAASSHSPAPAMLAAAISARSTGSGPGLNA